MLRGEVSHEVPIGATAQLTLPDGSSVVLNAGSTLTHERMMWGKTREVHLSGEAFLMCHMEKKPFVVTTEKRTHSSAGYSV